MTRARWSTTCLMPSPVPERLQFLDDLADLEVLDALDGVRHTVDVREIADGQGAVGPLGHQDELGARGILGEASFEQVLADDAGIAGREEPHVVVAADRFPGGRDGTQGDRQGDPTEHDQPPAADDDGGEQIKHVRGEVPSEQRGRSSSIVAWRAASELPATSRA
jgi:hypothetical protein